MRVLIFLPSAAVGGAERMTITLANHLRLAGCEPLLVLSAGGGALRGTIAPGVDVVELGARRVRHAIVPLARLIRRWHPDAVFASKPDATIGLTMAWRLAGQRGRLVVRESNHRTAQGFPRPSLFSRLLAWAYRQADPVIAPSRAVADDLVTRYLLPAQRIRVIYNAVDTQEITRAAGIGLSPWTLSGARRILGVGRLIEQKGFDVLLRAVAGLPNREVHVTLLGEGPQRQALESLGRELGLEARLSMPGCDVNPYRWMRAADVFVLSSRWEGFPNVLAEAMACGAPVIATRCPAGPEEMITHGVDGLLCAPESPEALREQLDHVLRDRAMARGLGQAAQRRAQRFDARMIAQEYAAALAGTPMRRDENAPTPMRHHEEQRAFA